MKNFVFIIKKKNDQIIVKMIHVKNFKVYFSVQNLDLSHILNDSDFKMLKKYWLHYKKKEKS